MNGRLRILVSAYACEPGRGSEPGVGWNWVQQIARHNDVCVITRANNRRAIETHPPIPNAHFVYFDLPRWARFWKRRKRGVYLYYYLWQIGAYLQARKLHRAAPFDIAHHVTFVTYWMPSFFALLPIPFVWGPVGGGESAPRRFVRSFSLRGRWFELFRTSAQAIGRMDPFVRLTARKSALAFASTQETADRMIGLGCRQVQLLSAMGMPAGELDALGRMETPGSGGPFRLVSIGDLLHWKGGELGLRAFARFSRKFPAAEYWFIGEGVERGRLERLSEELGTTGQVTFWGQLPREAALAKLAECDVLVHPSLHDSGGCVCSEALAAGRPVICLDLGGPALQVTPETGFKIPAISPQQSISDLAHAMERLATDPELYERMANAAKREVRTHLSWDRKGDQIARIYKRESSANQAGAPMNSCSVQSRS